MSEIFVGSKKNLKKVTYHLFHHFFITFPTFFNKTPPPSLAAPGVHVETQRGDHVADLQRRRGGRGAKGGPPVVLWYFLVFFGVLWCFLLVFFGVFLGDFWLICLVVFEVLSVMLWSSWSSLLGS